MPEPRFFTAHQAAVVEDATARIAPGPGDDPAERGHPGAREAGVTAYIDAMLSAHDEPPKIFAELGTGFAPLDPISKIAWRNRLSRGPGTVIISARCTTVQP